MQNFETIYTPQGDGNSFSSSANLPSVRNNLHPARGRKLADYEEESQKRAETIYTPQGDGNFAPLQAMSVILTKQSTPRKGTETGYTIVIPQIIIGNNLHPARGRKLPCCVFSVVGFGNNLHPARGRKRLCRYSTRF